MKNVIVIVGHPNIKASYANKHIINLLSQEKNVELRILSDLYPDFNINVEAEQSALLIADIIIFQYPLYWYNVPPILKLWIDEVLTYGFAFGKTGDKLRGKNLWLSITVGGLKSSYSVGGYNNFEFDQLLFPLYQTANHSGMKLTQVVNSFQMEYIPDFQNNLDDVKARAEEHANKLLELIRGMNKKSHIQ